LKNQPSEATVLKNARSIQAVIAAAADGAIKKNQSLTKNQLIERAYMDRFLSRIFSDPEDTDWALKGGSGIIARVPLGRRTTDIDLFRIGYSIEDALIALRRLAEVDLGDHFNFVYEKHEELFEREQQPNISLFRVIFQIQIGRQDKSKLRVDLVVGAGPVGRIVEQHPVGRLEISDFESFPYRLYPVEQQVAEKVCATLALYRGQPSSREKDLVDLVIIATTQEVNGQDLHEALLAELVHRGMTDTRAFEIPPHWGRGYAKLAKETPACAGYPTVGTAFELIQEFLNPAFSPGHLGMWNPSELCWC